VADTSLQGRKQKTLEQTLSVESPNTDRVVNVRKQGVGCSVYVVMHSKPDLQSAKLLKSEYYINKKESEMKTSPLHETCIHCMVKS